MGASAALTGFWTGVYFYPSAGPAANDDMLPPVPFTATLSEAAGLLAGQIREPGSVGLGAGERTASVAGTRSGDAVRFDKTYVGAHTVAYAGVLSSDGREITGTWTIPGDWSGEFRMQRSEERAARAWSRAAAGRA